GCRRAARKMPFPGSCGVTRQPGPEGWVAAGPEVVRAAEWEQVAAVVPAPAKRAALVAAEPEPPVPPGPSPGQAGRLGSAGASVRWPEPARCRARRPRARERAGTD